ncbi:MAG: MBL fold metallo-hydrolase [Spirochaetales bacterium]|nr:MBL fold metallo-hydrolase [Spirochaetales bacterium]
MLKITVFGSGTSHGIPVVGCSCATCTSLDPRDNRTRASVLIETANEHILIDTATEFRLQAVRNGLSRLDAVCFTHPHADHVHGLDDIRPLSRERPIPVYGSASTLREIKKRFDYVFKRHSAGGGVPRITMKNVYRNRPFLIGTTRVVPLEVYHGSLPIFGYRIGNFAYITDCSRIPETTVPSLMGLDLLIIGALRERSHPTHFSFSQAIELIERINPVQSYFTHISHNHTHSEICSIIRKATDKKIEPAYDGLLCTLE